MSSTPSGGDRPSRADLEAAHDAAKACLSASAHARAWFCDDAPPAPAAFLHETTARALSGLSEALERLPLVEKVEHLLATEPVCFAGAGTAATAHRAAFQSAHWTRNDIWSGLRNAVADETSALAQAVERLNGATVDGSVKKLCEEYGAARERFLAMSRSNRPPLTAEEAAALWCSGSWAAIRSALGDPLGLDDDKLGAAVECEYLRAKRAVADESDRPGRPHPDGPEGGRWVWWQGERHDVPAGNVYRLVEFMWERDSASYDSLDGPVFDGAVQPQTIRSYLSKANKVLLRIGVPWRIRADSEARYVSRSQIVQNP